METTTNTVPAMSLKQSYCIFHSSCHHYRCSLLKELRFRSFGKCDWGINSLREDLQTWHVRKYNGKTHPLTILFQAVYCMGGCLFQARTAIRLHKVSSYGNHKQAKWGRLDREVGGANKVQVDRQKTLYLNDTNLYLMYLATGKEQE